MKVWELSEVLARANSDAEVEVLIVNTNKPQKSPRRRRVVCSRYGGVEDGNGYHSAITIEVHK